MAVDAGNVVMPWPAFKDDFAWHQSEHVTLIGPTGCGKTTLGLDILDMREYVIILATKPRDPTLQEMADSGEYRVVSELPLPPYQVAPKVVFWPKQRNYSDRATMHVMFRDLLAKVYDSGGYTVYCDEVHYLHAELKLTRLLETHWRTGRSNDVSLVCATQRPTHIPLLAYSQASHVFAWRIPDARDVLRMSGIGFVNPRDFHARNAQLDRHDTLYANAFTGEMIRTNVKTGGEN